MTQRWDIFCRVIDNFGDIGVCWRLANTLTDDQNKTVRLWVDNLHALQSLKPTIDLSKNIQLVDNIEIILWNDTFTPTQMADVVIEAFGCELPPKYLEKMPSQPPVWINLDYFSAEPWVASFHAMPSKQPNGLDKYFFYPSILANTGGLMREADLLEAKQAFLAHNTHQAWLNNFAQTQLNSFKISLFCYENSVILPLIEAWKNSDLAIELFVPQGRIVSTLEQALRIKLQQHQPIQQGNLTLHLLPFLPQADYDKLLWSCDLNFVRGEESMVRAQWAGKPFIWHIYPTDDLAHWDKLNAFYQVYSQALNPTAQACLIAFNRIWNQVEHANFDNQAWLNLRGHFDEYHAHSEYWIQQLEKLGDLTSNLVKFVQSKV
ncbi:elongation factor P maturation arginine rhamnosyltransferase EarP [Thiomicrospira microaerophila]|uniref:elongation factor P maturation arginine rhamnosyltransferase EarP n=1 Tax=Thiomicrospira microaerophila TaxID=406020 RepID=UPI0005CB4031|nr:elongation factor P maturation arginine rhamnosyltransferase EarP [Thiomicrospira microaerophila]